jgi:hypothetical protein
MGLVGGVKGAGVLELGSWNGRLNSPYENVSGMEYNRFWAENDGVECAVSACSETGLDVLCSDYDD